LNYTRNNVCMVGTTRFEHATPWSQSKRWVCCGVLPGAKKPYMVRVSGVVALRRVITAYRKLSPLVHCLVHCLYTRNAFSVRRDGIRQSNPFYSILTQVYVIALLLSRTTF